MASAAKLIQTWQYKKTESPLASLPKRRRPSLGFPSHEPSPRPLVTRCSTRPGIGSDNATSSSNPAGVELGRNSASQITAHPSPGRANPASKQSKGLVFGLGSDSASWDAAEIGSPVVRRYIGDDEERWYMWYYGRDGASADSIGLATSSNGVCWARSPGAVGSSGGAGKVASCSSDWWAFDTRSVRPSDMVIMSSPMYSAVYWLYYTGYAEEEVELPGVGKAYRSLPGLACSQDGRNWARIQGDHHSGAVLDVGRAKEWDSLFIAAPKVVVHGDDDLRMYYHSYDAAKGEFAVGLARSRDGIRWVKLGKVVGSGREGAFDELGAVNAHVVRQGKQGKYVMAYEGVSRCGRRSVGVAASEDGLGGWTRVQDEPVLEPLRSDGWDDAAVGSPCLVQMEDGWRLYYKGVGQRGTTGIGMAVSCGGDVTRFRRWEGFCL